jgi:hypothetical protein
VERVRARGICVALAVSFVASSLSRATTCVQGKKFKVRLVCGIVTDEYGAAVPDARIEVISIAGGFSYRARKEVGSNMEIWQKGYSGHRSRDANDYTLHVSYIHNNSIKEGFCERAEEFPYSFAHPGFELDALPQELKPKTHLHPMRHAWKACPFKAKSQIKAQARMALLKTGREQLRPRPPNAQAH